MTKTIPRRSCRSEKKYSEAKRVLKQRKISFQTPYPAKLWVFYEDGMQLYQMVEKATTDLKARGLPISMVTRRETLAEQLSHLAWEIAGGTRPHGMGEEQEKNIRERFGVFRRRSSSPPEEL